MVGCHDGFQLEACFGHVRGAAGLSWVSAVVRNEDQPETKPQPFSQMFVTPVHFSLRLDGFPLKRGSIEPVEGIDTTATGCPGKSPVPYTRHRLYLWSSLIALVVLLSTWPACGGRSCLREPSHRRSITACPLRARWVAEGGRSPMNPRNQQHIRETAPCEQIEVQTEIHD
jgi:hypothetical protein